MNNLLSKQKELQLLLGSDYKFSSTGGLCEYIKDMSFFLNQEVVELIEEIAGTRDINKPWKSGYNNVYNSEIKITDKVKSEAIDVLKFTLNICLAAGITPENIAEEFDKVNNRCIDRYRNGY